MTQPYLGPDTGEDKGPNIGVDYNKLIVFNDPPDFSPFKDDQQLTDTMYYLRAAHQYRADSDLVITVPADFHTDLLSAPQISWSILGMPPCGYWAWAAIIHDYLYGLMGKLPTASLTRKQCDDILLEILTRLNVPWVKRNAAYLAVRLFGGSHWKGN